METSPEYQQFAATFGTLKPSLVEWKHSENRATLNRHDPLKPSLVEWKLVRGRREPVPLCPLETFLIGMETRPGDLAREGRHHRSPGRFYRLYPPFYLF